MSKKAIISIIVGVAVVLIGISVGAYNIVSNYINTNKNSIMEDLDNYRLEEPITYSKQYEYVYKATAEYVNSDNEFLKNFLPIEWDDTTNSPKLSSKIQVAKQGQNLVLRNSKSIIPPEVIPPENNGKKPNITINMMVLSFTYFNEDEFNENNIKDLNVGFDEYQKDYSSLKGIFSEYNDAVLQNGDVTETAKEKFEAGLDFYEYGDGKRGKVTYDIEFTRNENNDVTSYTMTSKYKK